MGCRRRASSTVLMVIVAIFLLALDHSVAHARQVRSPSMSTGEHRSTKEVLQATTTRKHGVEHTKGRTETVHMEPAGSTGDAGVVGLGRRVEQPSFGRGGNNIPSSAEKVVVARYGPRPHPKKHN